MKGQRRDYDRIYIFSEISKIIREKHDLASQHTKLAVQQPQRLCEVQRSKQDAKQTFIYLHTYLLGNKVF